MQKLIRSIVVGCAVLALMVPSMARAQNSDFASITATAVVSGAINVTAMRNLNLGTVIPGYTRTVGTTDATSGHFMIEGGVNAEVAVTFTSLPDNLVFGAFTLPISYTGTWNTTDAGGTGNAFTVALAGFTTRLGASTGELHVYLGGSVTPAGDQTAGEYTGTITLNAAYTGL